MNIELKRIIVNKNIHLWYLKNIITLVYHHFMNVLFRGINNGWFVLWGNLLCIPSDHLLQ